MRLRVLAIGPVRSAEAGESVQSVEKSPRKKTDDVARHVDLVIGAHQSEHSQKIEKGNLWQHFC